MIFGGLLCVRFGFEFVLLFLRLFGVGRMRIYLLDEEMEVLGRLVRGYSIVSRNVGVFVGFWFLCLRFRFVGLG